MRTLDVICVIGYIFFFTLSSVIGGHEKRNEDLIAPATRAVSSEVVEFPQDQITGKSASITTDPLHICPIIRRRRKREMEVNGGETTKVGGGGERKNSSQREKEIVWRKERKRNRERNTAERYNRDRKKGRKREPLTRHARKPQRRRTRRPHKEAGANRTRSPRQRGHERRNLEKQYLVRNRTLELLEKKATDAVNRSSFIYPVNNVREVIFERRITPEKIGQILGDGRRAPSIRITDLLIPKTFVEAAGSVNKEAGIKTDEKLESNYSNTRNEKTDEPPLFLGKLKSIAVNVSRMNKAVQNLKKNNSEVEMSPGEVDFVENSYRYDYEDVFEDPSVSPWVNPPRSEEAVAGREDQEYYLDTALLSSVYMPIDDQNTLNQGLTILLSRLFQTLRNTTDDENKELLQDLDFDNSVQGDLCQKWLDCKDKLEEAFLGALVLPACPCHYPSSIFYDDKIWDEGQQRHFRWRDVSGEAERLDVYKPGATYCIRSLLAQGGGSAAAQHCCYDGRRRLLTRGSGAGTPNFVSPEVSAILHERIDVLPWRLCKGDFSRFNKVRPPNNDNHCKENPNEDEYQRQIDTTKHY